MIGRMMRGVRRPAAALLIVGVLAASLVLCLPGVSTGAVAVGQGARTDGPVGPGYSYGALVTAQVSTGGFEELHCGLSAYYVVDAGGQIAVQFEADCEPSMRLNVALAAAIPGAWSKTTVSFQFNGPTCSVGGSYEGWDGSGLTPFTDAPCGVGEVCVDYQVIRDFAADIRGGPGCGSFAMGQPPSPVVGAAQDCENYEDVTTPSVSVVPSAEYGAGFVDVKIDFEVTRTAAGVGDAAEGYLLYRVDGALGGFRLEPDQFLDPINVEGPVSEHHVQSGAFRAEWDYEIVGFGWFAFGPTGAHTGPGDPNVRAFPQNDPDGLYGVNRPGSCVYYWGEKVAQIVDSDEDEPLSLDGPTGGGSTTPPTDSAPPAAAGGAECSFELSDPSTWLEGGMCAAVGLLGHIVGLVGDLIGAVVGLPAALIDLLDGLLIPSDGFIEDQFDGVQDAWSDTPPMVYADGLADVVGALSIPEPSGCDGPALNFSSPVGGQAVSLHPLSACGQYVAPVADLVKTALTVVVYVGAVLGAVRIVSSSLGVDAPKAGE